MTESVEKVGPAAAPATETVEERRARFSKTLSFQATKGRSSTRPVPFAPKRIDSTIPAAKNPMADNASSVPAESKPVEEGRPVTAAPVSIPERAPAGSPNETPAAGAEPGKPAVQPGAPQGNGEPRGRASNSVLDRVPPPGKLSSSEIVISIAASRELTRLFCALTVDPGSGPEVDAQTRTEVLNRLIGHAHQMADVLSRRVVNDSTVTPPIALRAKMLSACTTFLSRQWIETGRIDPEPFMALATDAFFAKARELNTEVLDLMDEAGRRTPIDNQERSQLHITQACVRAAFSCQGSVSQFNLHDYDEASASGVFSYGRSANEIAHDLTHAALSLARGFEIESSDPELQTLWTKNSIWRATELVCTEYTTITDRALRAAFSDALTSEAAISDLTRRYPDILKNVSARALASLQAIEQNAVDTMSALAYKAYLPRSNRDRKDSVGQTTPESMAKNEAAGTSLQSSATSPEVGPAPSVPTGDVASAPAPVPSPTAAHHAQPVVPASQAQISVTALPRKQVGLKPGFHTHQNPVRQPIPVPLRVAVPHRGG